MSLKAMYGFESIVEDSDYRAQGWLKSGAAITSTGVQVIGVPSLTAVAGTSLKLVGPYNISSGFPFQASNTVDYGMIDLGTSVYDAWNAGGFAVGWSGTFNTGTQIQVAVGDYDQIIYDGAQYYWAVAQINSSTFAVVYSTDLKNWTTTTASVPGLNATSRIGVQGNGPTATILVANGSATLYYSTSMGSLWTANATGLSGSLPRSILTTTHPTVPFLILSQGSGKSLMYSMTSGSSGLSNIGFPAFGFAGSGNVVISSVAGGHVCLTASLSSTLSTTGNVWYMAKLTNDIGAPGSWNNTATMASPSGAQTAMGFLNNLWISVGYGGIWTSPNPSTPPTVTYPTAAWTQRLNNGTFFVTGVAANAATTGTVAVAVGQDSANPNMGAIWTSTDAITWTKVNRIITTGASGVGWINVLWNGTNFVIVGGANKNVIATSPDGFNWSMVYCPDYAEGAVGFTGLNGAGVMAGTIGTNIFNRWSTTNGDVVGLTVGVGALSAGTRTASLGTLLLSGGNPTWTTLGASTFGGTLSTANLTHYYEIVCTKVAGTPNLFNVQFAIDGVLQSGNTQVQLAATGDTTGASRLVFTIPRNGAISAIDDVYCTVADGSGLSGNLGIVNIMPHNPTSDTQAQFTKSGSQPSNAAAAGGYALSNAGANNVSTFTDGAKDIYASSATIPSNYKVRAVQVEAYFAKTGTAAPNVNVGIVSGATESDSGTVGIPSATPMYVSKFAENDPNTGSAWTPTSAAASKLAVTKVS